MVTKADNGWEVSENPNDQGSRCFCSRRRSLRVNFLWDGRRADDIWKLVAAPCAAMVLDWKQSWSDRGVNCHLDLCIPEKHSRRILSVCVYVWFSKVKSLEMLFTIGYLFQEWRIIGQSKRMRLKRLSRSTQRKYLLSVTILTGPGRYPLMTTVHYSKLLS